MEDPVVRLHLFFARDVHKAVILRQGPTQVWRMILWDRRDDTFLDGQWTRQRVYPERCALSPDARHFIYFMLDGHWDHDGKGAYTALSQPPYWTALALFPVGHTWWGGGRFFDAVHYESDGETDIIGRDEGMMRVFRVPVSREYPDGLRRKDGTAFAPEPPRRGNRDVLLKRIVAADDHPLDRYDTVGGRLYRRSGSDLELIRDFTDMAFEAIRAPYDWRDGAGEDAPWHPLDGDAT